jgi:hypothetical protein
MSTSPHLIEVIAGAAGLLFETRLIASLHVATVFGVLIATRPATAGRPERRCAVRRARGPCWFSLVFGGPFATLRAYAACVDCGSPACPMG